MSFYSGPLSSNSFLNPNIQQDYTKAIMERDKFANSIIQPHTHNAQGQTVPTTLQAEYTGGSISNMGHMKGPLGDSVNTTISPTTGQLDFNKINNTKVFTGQQPIAAGGK